MFLLTNVILYQQCVCLSGSPYQTSWDHQYKPHTTDYAHPEKIVPNLTQFLARVISKDGDLPLPVGIKLYPSNSESGAILTQFTKDDVSEKREELEF